MFRITLVFAFFLAIGMQTQAQENFQFEPGSEHNMLFIIKDSWADAMDIGAGIAKFNYDYFAHYRLEVKRYKMPYLSKSPVYFVKGFKSQKAVMEYQKLLKDIKPAFYQMGTIRESWPVSDKNFNQILIQQSLENYPAFFKKHYMP